jgi:hypothetical protein
VSAISKLFLLCYNKREREREKKLCPDVFEEEKKMKKERIGFAFCFPFLRARAAFYVLIK